VTNDVQKNGIKPHLKEGHVLPKVEIREVTKTREGLPNLTMMGLFAL
jgi:hypothetical protein